MMLGISVFFLVMLAGLMGLGAGEEDKVVYESTDAVPLLTEQNYNEVTRANADADWVFFFMTPWCGHCKKFLPHVEKFGRYTLRKMPNVRVGKMDCEANPQLCAAFDIKGYPAVKLQKKDGTLVDFSDKRTAQGLKRFAEANQS